MVARWSIAVIGVVALAAVAANYYMPWQAQNKPMVATQQTGGQSDARRVGEFSKSEEMLTCPADAKPAPLHFKMKDATNKEVDFSSYKGKVVLVDFWATWCGPCKIEIPGFVEFQKMYGPRGFQVLGVSVDDTPKQLAPYIEQYQMNYPVLQGLGRDDVQDAFGPLAGIPTTFLISREGKICATHAGYTDKATFEREIKALL
ncbi:MAG TPA: TlpA disulfide reductase family protein [Vicinamibacterales bacterium]|jgi:thiol-disulfide isomerase/thioredoxin|nr:TlpA disulfide reductase family protein [Vicinamibacterales bacterium]